MSIGVSIHDLARRRRLLIQIELDFFKSRTNTTIEILSYLVENDRRAKIVTMTDHGRKHLINYTERLKDLLKDK